MSRFIELECYHPYYLIDDGKIVHYSDVVQHTFKTKLRLDMIGRVDEEDSFIAVPDNVGIYGLKKDEALKGEHKIVKYKRVVTLCHTNKGINGFQDSLYISERCFDLLDEMLEEEFGDCACLG